MRAVDELAPLRDRLAAAIETASPATLEQKLDKWQTHEDPHHLALLLALPAIQADLGGQLFVRTQEVPESVRYLAVEGYPTAFLDMSFAEAVAFFKERFPQYSSRVDDLIAGYINESDDLPPRLLSRLAEKVRQGLSDFLDNGGTFGDFATKVRAGAEEIGIGIVPGDMSYLETVYRTQTALAYGAGRFTQLTDPAVIAVNPYVQYVTMRDNRVRQSHADQDGIQYRADSTVWHKIAPPNGFNCRCDFISIGPDRFDPSRFAETVEEDPQDPVADPGFEGAPQRQAGRT